MSNFAVVQDGQVTQILPLDMPFNIGSQQYSAVFLRTSTPAEKLQAGIWEIIHGERPNDKYYWITGPAYRVNETNSTVEATYSGTAKLLDDREESDENGNPLYVQVLGEVDGKPAMVDSAERLVTKGLKTNEIATVKATANSLLSATDWMIIRKVERSVDVPADVATYRAAVITECTRLVAAITATTSVDELAAVTANWPAI